MKRLIVYFKRFFLIVSVFINKLFKKNRSLQRRVVTEDILFV
jgi:hypothetical protein